MTFNPNPAPRTTKNLHWSAVPCDNCGGRIKSLSQIGGSSRVYCSVKCEADDVEGREKDRLHQAEVYARTFALLGIKPKPAP